MPAVNDEKEYSCGLCSLRPKWLQKFANKQTFLAIFCLTSVLQGMYYTYFVSVLTTIEKLYQIQSKTTGMIMSATEIGQIGGALLLTYYGGHGHRPKWIACGMLIFAFASVLCSTPHYLFGSDIGIKSSPLKSDSTETMASLKLREHSLKLCFNSLSSEPSSALSTSSSSDYSSNNLLNTDIKYGLNSSNLNQSESLSTNSWSDSKCDHPEVINTKTRITTTVLSIFFVSLLLIGIGATAVNTLGIPYIDDNVAPKESPLYFGINIKTFYKLFHCSN
jgi:MFS family permease